MNTKKKRKALRPQALVEILFDASYLVFALTAGFCMLLSGHPGNRTLTLYGLLTLVLGCGDAFHLLPRIYGSAKDCMDRLHVPLGLGKMITSITMTIFYVLLYHIWLSLYGHSWASPPTAILYVLAALRILLSLFPQNEWFQGEGPLKWSILRNLPFMVMGIMIIVLFSQTAVPAGDGFRFLPLAVMLSFCFYIPVVLGSKKWPALGVLMLPKTMTYIWIISMGFTLIH